MSEPTPYGQPNPYAQQPSYGMAQQPMGDRRPGTVTAAAWITIVFSAITGAVTGLLGLSLLVAGDQFIEDGELDAELQKIPELRDLDITADQLVGVATAILLVLAVWALVAIVLAVLVLRRSNVSRILLVISSAVTAVLSLLGGASGVSLVLVVAAVAVIVLLFTGGAGDWFKRLSGGYPGSPTGYPSTQYGSPYGVQPGQDAPTPYPSSDNPYGQTPQPQPPAADNPYGQQPPPAENPYGQQPPPAENPYGQQPPAEGGTDYPDHPPRDYPGR
ncbi:hypothetical protein [Nocardioides astragali]|uniref:DUF4064 domain-containing protein n=1 Tax=Nocardioides astragali TaxID=1776736 RepID=A0ABW2N475_9ACTN|nr:hypothetical protein [Nocardioides astragali]